MPAFRTNQAQDQRHSGPIRATGRPGKGGTILARALLLGSFAAVAPAPARAQPVKSGRSQVEPHPTPMVDPRFALSPCWEVKYRQAWTCIDTYGTPSQASIVHLRSRRYGVLLHSRGVTTDGRWNGRRVVVYHGQPLCKISC